jgi:hypothetical protein
MGGIIGKKIILEGVILEIFCKENHFSEEKSHELSQVGRALTTHLCPKRRGDSNKSKNI